MGVGGNWNEAEDFFRDRVGTTYPRGGFPLRWPDDARVAIWVVPNVEVYDMVVPNPGGRDPWPRTPHPDVRAFAMRDYGNQAGFWRLADLLDSFPIRVTVSLNFGLCSVYPEIAEAIMARDWDVMCHGLSNTDYAYDWSAERERDYYENCARMCRELFGREMTGVLGPAISATERTCDILADLDVLYHADWLHDDVPTPLRVNRGGLISMPYSSDLNDVPQSRRGLGGEYFAEAAIAQFDELYREGSVTGRLMCLPLHPYLAGRPHMIDFVRQVIEHICGHEHIWWATGTEIARYYLDHYYGQHLRQAGWDAS